MYICIQSGYRKITCTSCDVAQLVTQFLNSEAENKEHENASGREKTVIIYTYSVAIFAYMCLHAMS